MAKKNKDQSQGESRRSFFRAIGLGAGAAGALAVLGEDAKAAEAVPQDGAAGYRETDHVKRVYALARF
jgi:hypothetical protein